MKYSYNFHEAPIPSRDLVYSLSLMQPALIRLRLAAKAYRPLLDILAEMPDVWPRPTGKSIQEKLGISSSVFRRWLDEIYADAWELVGSDASVLDFTNAEYEIEVPDKKDFLRFKCRLSVPPRVGEAFDVKFLGRIAGRFGLYVDKILYELEGSKTIITVTLREGSFNPYLHHLRYRARFEHRLTFEQEYSMNDGALAEYLRQFYEAPPKPAPAPIQAAPARHKGRYGQWR
ncbi:hypothetical protein QMK33_06695 [Hymenobacter sp. H14-R3]|uniref:hypothetical protein n=1 Tax=Hymenobacter sp. H14-R3 TaxID=3046308 RepID=UPI0024B94447|nr:hypothetical protein [Hymenobacter sp. H14-R3]MDJ0364835.1 hypothetical protein [Hymenobacter sp. H14-R3]